MLTPDPDPPAADTDEASELENDSDGKEGPQETQEVRHVVEPPINVLDTAATEEEEVTHGCEGSGTQGAGASGWGVWCGSRPVRFPFQDRTDVRCWAMYCGNWGGRRREQWLNEHIAADIVARCPAQVLIAQEVDEEFVRALKEPRSSREAQSTPRPAIHVRGVEQGKGVNYEERVMNLTPWHVAFGDEGEGSDSPSLLIAARSSLARACRQVTWEKIYHRAYKYRKKDRRAYSRLLTAQIEWERLMHGRRTVGIMNIHFHHKVAKKEPVVVVISNKLISN